MDSFAFGAPGPIELLIIALMLAGGIGVVVLVVVLARRASPPPMDNPNLYPCPDCGSNSWCRKDGAWVCVCCHPEAQEEFMFRLNPTEMG